MSTKNETPRDPLIEAQIERTLKPYRGIATAAMLETMREQLEEMLTTDPLAVAMIDQLRARATPDVSGVVLREGAEHEADNGERKA